MPFDADWLADFVPRDLVAEQVVQLVDAQAGDSAGPEIWLTAGRHALTVRESIAACVDLGDRAGWAVATPRYVPPDVYERLIAPVFLPAAQRRMVGGLFENFAPYIGMTEPFPTSLPHPPDLRLALRRSIDYWAAAKGVV